MWWRRLYCAIAALAMVMLATRGTLAASPEPSIDSSASPSPGQPPAAGTTFGRTFRFAFDGLSNGPQSRSDVVPVSAVAKPATTITTLYGDFQSAAGANVLGKPHITVTVQPTETTSLNVQITVDANGVAPGSYSGTIQIVSPDISPIFLNVSATVKDPPWLAALILVVGAGIGAFYKWATDVGAPKSKYKARYATVTTKLGSLNADDYGDRFAATLGAIVLLIDRSENADAQLIQVETGIDALVTDAARVRGIRNSLREQVEEAGQLPSDVHGLLAAHETETAVLGQILRDVWPRQASIDANLEQLERASQNVLAVIRSDKPSTEKTRLLQAFAQGLQHGSDEAEAVLGGLSALGGAPTPPPTPRPDPISDHAVLIGAALALLAVVVVGLLAYAQDPAFPSSGWAGYLVLGLEAAGLELAGVDVGNLVKNRNAFTTS